MTTLTALSGLFGGIIGAVLTYWLGIRADVTKSYQKQRTDAYVEFIEAVAAIATGQRVWDQEKLDSAITRFTQAKSKIAIYGSRSVATALADFVRRHEKLDSKEAFQSFGAIVALMRADSANGTEPLNTGDIEQIFFQEVLPLS
jgi:hypothetical protein